MIEKDDLKDLTAVVAEHNSQVSSTPSQYEETKGEMQFTNETLLTAAKVVLYTTLKSARLVDSKARTKLLEEMRGLKGSKREKLQARLKGTFDCIYLGPEETSEDQVVRALEERRIKPHWRRGFFREQRCGEGLKLVKQVLIAPVLVNARLVDGESPPPKDYILE